MNNSASLKDIPDDLSLSEVKLLFESAGIPDAAYDAEMIFQEIGGISRIDIKLSNPKTSDAAVIAAVKRRLCREPLQYIIGKAYFFRILKLFFSCLTLWF